MNHSDAVRTSVGQSPDVNEQEIKRLALADAQSWWIRGRRALIRSVVRRHRGRAPAGVVGDLGCGAGSLFEVFSEYGAVVGIDVSPLAAALCRRRGYPLVAIGSLEALPVGTASLDMIGLTDVLEHFEDDALAIRECGRALRPGGLLVLTVPAIQRLYGGHDRALGHFRRYSRGGLCRQLAEAGLAVERITYFNTILLPAALLARLLSRVRPDTAGADPLVLPKPWNWLAFKILALEGAVLRYVNLPVGLSILAIARRCPPQSRHAPPDSLVWER